MPSFKLAAYNPQSRKFTDATTPVCILEGVTRAVRAPLPFTASTLATADTIPGRNTRQDAMRCLTLLCKVWKVTSHMQRNSAWRHHAFSKMPLLLQYYVSPPPPPHLFFWCGGVHICSVGLAQQWPPGLGSSVRCCLLWRHTGHFAVQPWWYQPVVHCMLLQQLLVVMLGLSELAGSAHLAGSASWVMKGIRL